MWCQNLSKNDTTPLCGSIIVYMFVALLVPHALAASLIPNLLINPSVQPMFSETVLNALDPGFIYTADTGNRIKIGICRSNHQTGLVDEISGEVLYTSIYGYEVDGDSTGCTWPGQTFQVHRDESIFVTWENRLQHEHQSLLTSLSGDSVLDTNLHWAYSIDGFERFSVENDGWPIVPHLHGCRCDSIADGNPEYFFSPNFEIVGPLWVNEERKYENKQPAGALWYHDHAMGITRLTVYAGLAGFYFIRDDYDTGKLNNPLNLPVFPYEAAFAIQDRMFKVDGSLFFPSFPGEPFYKDFIEEEGAELPPDRFPNGGPTILAEFFGDVMVVNGKIWPRMEVEPRNYRLRLLNGCDSRFLIIQFVQVELGETDFKTSDYDPIPFTAIGNDQGLAASFSTLTSLLLAPGARSDIIINFRGRSGARIIMANLGPDEPFSGDDDDFGFPKPGPSFLETDRIMAFDVVKEVDVAVPDNFVHSFSSLRHVTETIGTPTRIRKVALFEGTDEYGRLEPLLGTAEPATDFNGNPIYWPDGDAYRRAGLAGLQMEGAMSWHHPTTENPRAGDIEEWEIWNVSADAHPMHLHLTHFEVVGRNAIVWDSNTEHDERVLDPHGGYTNSPAGDGTYLVRQPLVQRNGSFGEGLRIVNPTMGRSIRKPDNYFEDGLTDVVTALPGQVTRIKAAFPLPGRYVWHCHVLSHEDKAMMRVMHVSESQSKQLTLIGSCTSEDSCGLCEGHCNSNIDCKFGLECFRRSSYEEVPGCKGSGVSGVGYCYNLEASILPPLAAIGSCTTNNPCGICEGDCDSDSDCANHLKCFQRGDDEEVPGCSGNNFWSTDFCYDAGEIDSPADVIDLTRFTISQCTESDPCGLCEGDCDSDSHCTNGLRCFQRNADEDVPGCGSPGIENIDLCYDPGQETDSWVMSDPDLDYVMDCSENNPCGVCQGHCSSNLDCMDGLDCFHRNDSEEVPGCDGTGFRRRDFCYDPSVLVARDPALTFWGECSEDHPCDVCVGDCDSNSDCAVGLDCFQRDEDEKVPGCTGSGFNRVDFCYDPTDVANAQILPNQEHAQVVTSPELTYVGECSSDDPCGFCEGDCDSDVDCKNGLFCFQRSYNEEVPGCVTSNGFIGMDFCTVF